MRKIKCGQEKFCLGILIFILALRANAGNFDIVKDRLEADLEAFSPIVAHVTVVLCTNRKKKTEICDENKARTNLYWGARYGIKTYFKKSKSWEKIAVQPAKHEKIIERVLYKRVVSVGALEHDLYLLADVWRGGDVKDAIDHFFLMSSGENVEKMKVGEHTLYAGGEAHVTAYLGHNGLKRRTLSLELEKNTMPNAAIVLGRHTAKTFTQPLRSAGTFPLLTTKGVVTPEAYTLEAALIAWMSTLSPAQTRQAAAESFAKYQNASLGWSKSLFVAGSTGNSEEKK